MISKLRRKLTLLFASLTILLFLMTQFSMMYTYVLDIWRSDLSRVNHIAYQIVEICMEGGSIQTIDLSGYTEQKYWICLTNGQEENTNAHLWGDSGRELEELVRTGQKTGPDMTGSFDNWEGFLNVYPVVGQNQSRVYVANAEFAGNKMLLLFPCKSLWENILYFMEMYGKYWAVTFAAICVLSYYLVRKALQPVAASIQSQQNFVAAASHELKAPMAVIQANAEVLDSDNLEKKRRVILEECKAMAGLIQSLLALAASDSGKQQLRLQETNVDTLLIEVWEAFQETARKKHIHLELEMEEHYPHLFCDGERLRQAISIFVDNAICYSPAGASVLLGARLEKGNVVFSVIDHGSGIPDCEKEKVFERFYSCDPSRTDKSHYGLGLSIAKEIIKAHHGTIHLTDTPNGGCTFEIRIPI